ncbi:glycoside hydrolase family 128 protein [Postia placenta MAD-698-R-SB12]|uniref:Glycoside hydrolase family 128 protein n=1 Tax=Postia placenta MAD-698-R-SB12 TaxID=670580 RepID=A0A1X6N167_9APHY|nr:glycoside hydrolase family 128 protein [Postia placenta MAD-698-R-SB12]OSX62357.1 glycoside hydrolase family 128 protein [Postia placenta MAD-698-R-SB12]
MKLSTIAASSSILCGGIAAAAHVPDFHMHHKRALDRRTTGAAFSSGIKRGLAFSDASLTQQFTSEQVSWAYNWDSDYSGTLPSGVAYIPMLWSAAPELTSKWQANAESAIANGAPYLLGFNEPDDSTQANMTAQEAADAWMTYMEPFAGRAKLVSPAVTNGGAPMGKAWLDAFMQACSQCTIDAVAIHIYDYCSNEPYYQSYIEEIAQAYGKPVWLTEFGAAGSPPEKISFLQSMTSWMDNQSFVGAYAWFMVAPLNLVNSDGSLTGFGLAYLGESP